MQILKDEVYESIKNAALIEFKQNGYEKSSMRSIAKRAGITVGNMYRYFPNKEGLFNALIKPVYDRIVSLIQKEHEPLCSKEFKDDFIEYLVNVLIEIFNIHKLELLILIDGSQGTAFEGSKNDLIDLFENHLKDECLKTSKAELDPFVRKLVAKTYIEGLITIFKNYNNDVEKRDKIYKLNEFCFYSFN